VVLDLQEGLDLAQAAPDTLEDTDVAGRMLGIFGKN